MNPSIKQDILAAVGTLVILGLGALTIGWGEKRFGKPKKDSSNER